MESIGIEGSQDAEVAAASDGPGAIDDGYYSISARPSLTVAQSISNSAIVSLTPTGAVLAATRWSSFMTGKMADFRYKSANQMSGRRREPIGSVVPIHWEGVRSLSPSSGKESTVISCLSPSTTKKTLV